MKEKIGLCITGSFCTFKKILSMTQDLVDAGYDITPIFSFNTANCDTRFFNAKDFKHEITQITGKPPLCTLQEVEPIGPKKLIDICLVAPTTGNTLAKIKNGITDTPVTMAVKSHLRNNLPVLIFISTNDGLSASAQNIGELINRKNIYFVPFAQDMPESKPFSIISKFELVQPALTSAIKKQQLQPILSQ